MSKNSNTTQMIVKDVIAKIQSGEYPLHSKIPSEMKLAEMFQVGRSTVREALSVLKSLNIVESRQGGGHYIIDNNVSFLINSLDIDSDEYQKIKDLFEVRYIMEPEAAALAAQRRTEEDLEKLYEILNRFKRVLETDEEVGKVEDFHFHKTLINATHNPIMINLMNQLSDIYQKTLDITLKQNIGYPSKRQQVYREHESIYLAIKDGQPELAKVYCKIHLDNVLNKINYMYNIKDTISRGLKKS
jgi:GntR family transcriptional regulator, transcriptional repressor for pyruvate dehydrogenase complex